MGEVSEVYLYAGKIIRGGLDRAKTKKHFEREVAIMQSLEHDNIISFQDAFLAPLPEFLPGAEGDMFYILTNKCEGGSIADKWKDGRLDEQFALVIMQHLASAVKHLHDNNIVHGDIKPDNVLFAKPNDPR